MLDRLPDLILDTPDAPEIIGKFIARADSDSCLPTDFLEKERYQATDALVRRSLDYCYALTKDPRSVQTCWGTAIGGFTDTSTLSEKVGLFLNIQGFTRKIHFFDSMNSN